MKPDPRGSSAESGTTSVTVTFGTSGSSGASGASASPDGGAWGCSPWAAASSACWTAVSTASAACACAAASASAVAASARSWMPCCIWVASCVMSWCVTPLAGGRREHLGRLARSRVAEHDAAVDLAGLDGLDDVGPVVGPDQLDGAGLRLVEAGRAGR